MIVKYKADRFYPWFHLSLNTKILGNTIKSISTFTENTQRHCNSTNQFNVTGAKYETIFAFNKQSILKN